MDTRLSVAARGGDRVAKCAWKCAWGLRRTEEGNAGPRRREQVAKPSLLSRGCCCSDALARAGNSSVAPTTGTARVHTPREFFPGLSADGIIYSCRAKISLLRR